MPRKTYTKKPRTYRKKVSTKKYVKKSRPVSKSVKKYVKSAITRMAEEKFLDQGLGTQPLGYTNPTLNPVYQPLILTNLSTMLDNCVQGVNQSNRIGNEIIIKRWSIRCAVTPDLVDITIPAQVCDSQQIYATLYMGYRKDFNVISPLILQDFFQAGDTNYGPSGAILDRLAYVNKDSYVILFKKTMKLGTSAPIYGSTISYPNNDFKLSFLFNIPMTKFFGNHKIKYNDTIAKIQDAKINALALWVLQTNADGSAFSVAVNNSNRQSNWQITANNSIMYTDM